MLSLKAEVRRFIEIVGLKKDVKKKANEIEILKFVVIFSRQSQMLKDALLPLLPTSCIFHSFFCLFVLP